LTPGRPKKKESSTSSIFAPEGAKIEEVEALPAPLAAGVKRLG
jgi:hypothetical protein